MGKLSMDVLNNTISVMETAAECCGGFNSNFEKVKFELLKELKEYKELEEQGRLLKLACAVGDTVYEVQDIRKRIQPYTITSVSIGRNGTWFSNWKLKDGQGFYGRIDGFPESYLGVKVFLTQEEAEAALQKIREGDESDA